MISEVLDLYITMLPLVLSGIVNMLFVRTKVYKRYKYPIDCNKNWIDGKRIFGENKTIIGFISMIIFYGIFQVLWGLICNDIGLNSRNDLYLIYENTVSFNFMVGLLFGFAYMIFELPNSFIKRRLDIAPGKTNTGIKGIFFIIDQIDSLIGVFIVLMVFNNMSFKRYMAYLIVGGFTHIFVNGILFCMKIRRNL